MIGDSKSMVEVGISMVLRDNFTTEAGRVSNSFRNMMQDMGDWNRGIQMTSGQAFDLGKQVIGGMYEVYKYSAKVSDTVFMASKIAGATAKEQGELMQLAQEVNAVTPLTAADIASGQKYLAMAGNSVQQIKDMTSPAAKLSSILGQPMGGKGGVADLMTNIMSMYVIPSEKAAAVTDDLYTAVTNANMSLTDLAQSITYAGADMANAGYDLRQTAAAIGVLGDMGIQGSAAGTALANMIRYLQLSISTQKKKGYNMLQNLGLSPEDFLDAQGNLIRLDKVYAKFAKALEGKTTIDRTKAFYNIFGVRGTRDISNQIRNMISGSNKMAKILEQYDKNSGIVERVTQERLQTPQGIIDQFNSSLENLTVNTGASLARVFNPILQFSTQISKSLHGLSLTGGGDFAIRLTSISVIVATIINGVRMIRQVFTMINAYTSMVKSNTLAMAGSTKQMALAAEQTVAMAVALDARMVHILTIMREMYYIQMAMAKGYTIGPRGGWIGPNGKPVKKPAIPGGPIAPAGTTIVNGMGNPSSRGTSASTTGTSGGTTPTPPRPAPAGTTIVNGMGRLARVGGALRTVGMGIYGLLGGPIGIGITAISVLATYLPELIKSNDRNTESNYLKYDETTRDELFLKAIKSAIKESKQEPSKVNITIDGKPVASYGPGEHNYSFSTQFGLV